MRCQNYINVKSNLMKRIVPIVPRKLKKHAERNKANNCSNKIESKDVKIKTIKKKKIRVEVLGDSMLNYIQEKG